MSRAIYLFDIAEVRQELKCRAEQWLRQHRIHRSLDKRCSSTSLPTIERLIEAWVCHYLYDYHYLTLVNRRPVRWSYSLYNEFYLTDQYLISKFYRQLKHSQSLLYREDPCRVFLDDDELVLVFGER